MRLVKGLLERCTEMMERLAAGPLGVSELAAALDMPKSAVHRLLQELRRLAWVEQTSDGRYRASLGFALLGSRVMQASGLPDQVQPLLDRLAAETRELVRLTIVTGKGLAWLASAQGAPAGLVYAPEMAGPVRLFATANGKALLARMPAADALALARADGFGTLRPTERSLHDAAALLADLTAVRRRGYAIADGEAESGVTAVAVAIGNIPRGTVSVAGPSVRLPASRHAALAASLTTTAAALANRFPFNTQQQEPIACASN